MTVITDATDLSRLPWQKAVSATRPVEVCYMAEPFVLDTIGWDEENYRTGDYLIRYSDGSLRGCEAADADRWFTLTSESEA